MPYLSVSGPQGSGKTTILELLQEMVFAPIRSSSQSTAVTFRMLKLRGGTLLMDEAEQLSEPGAGDIVSVLLSGYKQGSPVYRCGSKENDHAPEEFDVFGPKAIAAINELPPQLTSRCIPLPMRRSESAKTKRRISQDQEKFTQIRDDLYSLSLIHGQKLLELSNDETIGQRLTNRNYELWYPLLVIAKFLDASGSNGLYELVHEYAQEIANENMESMVPASDEALLRSLTEFARLGRSATIMQVRDCAAQDVVALRQWDPRKVAARLRHYDIKTTKSNGHRVYKDVTIEHLRDIERRYGFDLDTSAGIGTNDPNDPVTPGP